MELRRNKPLAALCLHVMLVLGLVFAATQAAAHRVNESYVFFNISDDDISGRIEVSGKDLARAFNPDDANPTAWEREEVTARAADILDYFDGRLLLEANGQSHPIALSEVTFLDGELIDGSIVTQLQFSVPGLSPSPDAVEVSYDFLFSDIDPRHRGLALIESNALTGLKRNESHISLVFQAGDGLKTLHLAGDPAWDVFVNFVTLGAWHILRGFDHLLFLAALLVTSVMVMAAGKWQPAPNLNQALGRTLINVTLFTALHTAAMGGATLSGLRLPIVLVDAVLALAIVLLALGNMVPKLHIAYWKLIALFAIVHGVGYAGVLAPLGIDPSRITVGLLGFNIGVELGQVAVVIILFPVLFVLRKLAVYRPVILFAGSLLLLGLALFWYVERTFDVMGPITQMVFG